MNLYNPNDTVHAVIRAMREGRIGFSLQQVNSADEPTDVLYSECFGRLVQPTGRVVTAGEFVALLEASGNVCEFDRYILDLALDWLSSHACGSLGVNISAENLSDSKHWAALYDQLSRHRSVASRLVLEITESSPMTSFSQAAELIQDVRNLGYRVAVDDFGTGFSTPESLFSIPVDIVKIDAFFVKYHKRQGAGRFLEHMVGLAVCAAPIVIIEGIETYDQFAFAKTAGATHIQGYLLSEPTLHPVFQGRSNSFQPSGMTNQIM